MDKDIDFSPLGGAVAMIMLEKVSEESLVEALDEEDDIDEEEKEQLREIIDKPEEEQNQTVVMGLEVFREEDEEDVDELVSKIADLIEPHVDKDHFVEQNEVEEEEGLEDYLKEAMLEVEEEFEGEV